MTMKTEEEIREAMSLIKFSAQTSPNDADRMAWLYSGMEWALGENDTLDSALDKIRRGKAVIEKHRAGIEVDLKAELAAIMQ